VYWGGKILKFPVVLKSKVKKKKTPRAEKKGKKCIFYE